MKKTFLLKVCLALVFGMVFAAGGKEPGKTELTLWHSFSGNAAKALQMIVDQFNTSQDRIYVDAQYQGSYEESLNKLKASMRTKSGPDMVQIYEAGTRFMVDSGFVLPMQSIINKYKIDVSNLEENILAYYTINNQLYSIPMNTSVPICYYNKTILSQLGYKDGPKSWDDIITISQTVQQKNMSKWGIALSTNMWWFELMLLQQGVNLVDQNNGRSGAATRTVFAKNNLSYQIAEKWLYLYKNNYASNTGFSSSDCRTVFFSGMAPIILDSSSSLRDYIDVTSGKFELAVCALPTLNKGAANGGVTLGGASLYVIDNNKYTDKKLDSIAEFIKYLISADAQSILCLNTGYYSVTKSVYDLDSVKKNLQKYPQYVTVRDIMRESKNMGKGAIYGVFTEGRSTYKNYFEEMLLGEITPKECIDKSARDIDILISEYNIANK